MVRANRPRKPQDKSGDGKATPDPAPTSDDSPSFTPLETLPLSRPPGRDLNAEADWVDPAELEAGKLRLQPAIPPPRSEPVTELPSTEPEYRVGKGRPPREHQQKAGEASKNPRGRPPGIPNPEPFLRRMHRKKAFLTGTGKTQKMTVIEELKRRIADDAARGNRFAVKLMEKESARDAALVAEADREARKERLKTDAERYIEDGMREMAEERKRNDLLYAMFFPPKYRDLDDVLRGLVAFGILVGGGNDYALAPGMDALFPLTECEDEDQEGA